MMVVNIYMCSKCNLVLFLFVWKRVGDDFMWLLRFRMVMEVVRRGRKNFFENFKIVIIFLVVLWVRIIYLYCGLLFGLFVVFILSRCGVFKSIESV